MYGEVGFEKGGVKHKKHFPFGPKLGGGGNPQKYSREKKPSKVFSPSSIFFLGPRVTI